MRAVIYGIFVLSTRQVYVGASTDYIGRWNSHLCKLRKGQHKNTAFQQAFSWNGEEWGLRFRVLEWLADCTDEQLVKREKWWLNHYRQKLGRKGVLNRAAPDARDF